MVMGLGILGQFAVMYARAAGAYPVIACDPVQERREEALKNGAELAILKQSSPSCGSGNIYDGTFTGNKISGDGITAALLKKNGIKVITETEM